MPIIPNTIRGLWHQLTGTGPTAGAARSRAIGPLMDLPLRDTDEDSLTGEITGTDRRLAAREASALAVDGRREAQEAISLPMSLSMDADEDQFRRLTTGSKVKTRDLSLLQQDRMLEIAWWLWEQNPLAKRLIVMMTHLLLGEGVRVQAKDEAIQAEIDKTWNHPLNVLPRRILEFHNALSLSGELFIPVANNEVTGRPIFGFLDPWEVKRVHTLPGNVLIPDIVELKPEDPTQTEGKKLKVVRVNPATDLLEGEIFYCGINKLPNSTRGRSDLLPLADWLDLYDQYLFAEIERLNLLAAHVWDYKIDGADQKIIDSKKKLLGTPKAGTVFAHNEKESLTAVTPDLKATDRSEIARMLRTHIAGGIGYPAQWLGDGTDSNRATMDGQNDVAFKTPAARQKEFAFFLDDLVRYTVQSTTRANRALFAGATQAYSIVMPEIAAKDVARVGGVVQSVAAAMDTSMANATMSKRAATLVMVTVLKHLGIDLDVGEVLKEAEAEADERQEQSDERALQMAQQMGGAPLPPGMKQPGQRGQKPGQKPGRTNPPVEDPDAVAAGAR